MYIKDYSVRLGSINNGGDLLEVIEGKKSITSNKVADIDSVTGIRKYRRMDRMSLLGEILMGDLMKDYEPGWIEEKKFGSVLNTSYGCLDTNIKFIREFISGDESQISAIDFSHTVYNAALGHMCTNYRMKGPSTMLLSSNYISVAKQLLNDKKAEYVMAGGIEPFSEELNTYMQKIAVNTNESGCLFLLSNEKNEDDIGEIVDYAATFIDNHPYMIGDKSKEGDDGEKIRACMEKLKQKIGFDEKVAFIVESTPFFGNHSNEDEAINIVFPGAEKVYIREKTNETFGASLGVAILYAALRIKRDGLTTAVVNHMDINGTFVSYLIKR